jgi:signal transduction histidine kinase
VLRLAIPDAEARGTVIREELDEGLPTIMGDRIQLEQVVLNLMVNAAQAMRNVQPESRRVTVRTAHHGGSVHLSVEDRGVGLDDEQLEQIFDAFYTSRTGGIGMGLSISRSIIEAHEGKIWARQNPDRGATFHVTLPAAPSPGNEPAYV